MDGNALLEQIQGLTEVDVLTLGLLHVEIAQLWTDDEHNRDVVLTGNRRFHYLKRHPEMSLWEELLAETVLDPDEVHYNRYDAHVAVFYRWLDEDHYLRVAVLMQARLGRLKHSILSYRFARAEEVIENANRRVWQRRPPRGDQRQLTNDGKA